ncbi:hypothetical protein, partial [Klebsiella oxytoca]|uniref:hypothetical protein n=1 Tax=Klebsiella oxytoca TaxID=571 RepID=UPI001954E61A
MIGGSFVVRDGRLLTLDLAKLAREAEAARERLEVLNGEWRGLFERLDAAPAGAGGLRIEIDASNPAKLALGVISGGAPGVTVQGDAAFAGEMHWLMDN